MPKPADLRRAFPYARGQTGQIGCPQGGGLPDHRAAYRSAQNVRLKLHQKAVAAGAAVHFQLCQPFPRVLFHGVHQIHALVGDGFLGGTDNVLRPGAPGDAHDGAPGVHIPIGRAQSRKGGHQIDAAGGIHLLGIVFRISGLADEAHLVAQPLDDGAAHKDRTLQCVLHLTAEADGDGGDKAVLALTGRPARVHEQETAGAVGVFGVPRLEAALAEQGGLLVAGDPGNGHVDALNVAVAVDLAGIAHLGQHGAGNAQLPQQPLVPLEGVDVVEHGARGVGVVCGVYRAVGQLPQQPGVHGAEQQISALCFFPGAGYVVQNPLDLGGGEVGVQHQSGGFSYVVGKSPLTQLVAQGRGAAALPDDSVVYGLACGFVPDHRGLALIGDADGGDVRHVDAAGGNGLHHDAVLTGVDLHGIMLYPAALGVVLGEFLLRHGDDVLLVVEQNGAAAGGSLIQRENVLAHRCVGIWPQEPMPSFLSALSCRRTWAAGAETTKAGLPEEGSPA